ncbi:impact-related [Holotrichia oblita]|uniref:Impact-related n=1 Tax=Holotrichia oblita TaxID=644536 RepID=A0ACB9TTW8_HOLOL|nr:impact-related [Holotrichia oblita]
MDNLVQQKDELEALSSIYGSDWKEESDSSCYFSIEIDDNVKVYITLNSEYPSNSPPSYQLQAPSLDRSTKQQISNGFEEIYLENIGGPVIFQWIERLREIVSDWKEKQKKETHREVNPPDNKVELQTEFAENECVMNILLENKKIAQATHNISAYRIKTDTGSILQDCDDDGENHAGGRLLHLLQILNVTNVFVVVSRWYGGVQLGPDRFRHINNAARQVLGEAGVIKL